MVQGKKETYRQTETEGYEERQRDRDGQTETEICKKRQ